MTQGRGALRFSEKKRGGVVTCYRQNHFLSHTQSGQKDEVSFAATSHEPAAIFEQRVSQAADSTRKEVCRRSVLYVTTIFQSTVLREGKS
jgi:hypothetical protein